MKIDREKLAAVAAMSDSDMWREICAVASLHGYKLPSTPPAPQQMAKIREAMTQDTKINLLDAMTILKNYKKSCK